MAINPLTLIQRVRALILDAGAVRRIADPLLLSWLNEALAGLATTNPYASTGFAGITLPANPGTLVLVQEAAAITTPIGTTEILRVLQIPGAREVSEMLMDLEEPGWRDTLSVVSSLLCWVRYGDSSRGFYTYPRLAGGAEVRALCCFRISPLASLSATLPLPDAYSTPLVNWVCARALRQDSDNVTNQTLAQDFEKNHAEQLAALAQAEATRWTI